METGKERHGGCKEIFALLSEYLDLELPDDACREIEMHIADCPPCIEFAGSLRKTVELCRGFDPGELPRPLTRTAREKLLGAYRKMMAARGQAEPE